EHAGALDAGQRVHVAVEARQRDPLLGGLRQVEHAGRFAPRGALRGTRERPEAWLPPAVTDELWASVTGGSRRPTPRWGPRPGGGRRRGRPAGAAGWRLPPSRGRAGWRASR